MSNPITLPDFDQLADIYWRLGVMQSPSQLQGFLLGQLVVGEELGSGQWLEQVADFTDSVEPPNPQEGLVFQQFYAGSAQQLASEDMALQLLLPDDGADIGQRIDSLGQWCQGFLAGFAMAGKQVQEQQGQQQYSAETAEALSDMAAISQIELSEGDEDEQQREQHYFEISEYLRLAVMSIYLECRHTVQQAVSEEPAKAAESSINSPGSLFNKGDNKLH